VIVKKIALFKLTLLWHTQTTKNVKVKFQLRSALQNKLKVRQRMEEAHTTKLGHTKFKREMINDLFNI
jgi:hypothetical protein